MGCLYILEFPSGKSYIGITAKTTLERLDAHMKQLNGGRNHAVHNAIRKYGVAAVSAKTLVIANDMKYLGALERRAIKTYGTKTPKGYNLTDGGEGVLGLAEESKKKMSDSQKEAWKKTKSERNHHLVNMREKLREAMADPVAEQERRERISATMKARSAEPANKARLGAISKKVWDDAASRESLLIKREGGKQKMIDAKRAWFANPANAEKIAAANAKRSATLNSPENKVRASEKSLAFYARKK